ncbi:MAG TPA: hypothetical protein VFE48_06310 [Methylomirabilota bacterium]|nr:hypothetical protein [Methylomirabilota bacterium]
MLLLVVAGMTSLGAGLALRRSGVDTRGLGATLGEVFALAGTVTLFYLANVTLGLGIVLGVRSLSSHFISAYLLDDSSLLVLSLLQGVVFFCWRRRRSG